MLPLHQRARLLIPLRRNSGPRSFAQSSPCAWTKARRFAAAPSLTAQRVMRVLERLCEWHGTPQAIRSDNGPEFRSEVLQAWARDRNIRWDFIQPGCPAQNAYIERFNGTYHLEVLDANQFQSLEQARTVTEEWLAIYNEQRTHSAIGHLPPLAFKRRWQSREFPVISGLG